jgi:chromosome partitioning protein
MRIIALMNQKGGVGKTTTTVNLGAALAEMGKKVCLLDLDPQGHLSINYGIEPSADITSLYDVLVEDKSLLEALHDAGNGIAVVPGSIDLAAAEVELVSVMGRETILKKRLEAALPAMEFDYLLIDCPPSLGILTINALAVAHEVIIPMLPHFLALQGMAKLLETVQLVSKRLNPKLRIGGIVLTMYDPQTRLTGDVMGELETFIVDGRGRNLPWSDAIIFETKIRRNIKLAESPSFGQTVIAYDGKSAGANDYRRLAREVAAMEKPTVVEKPIAAPKPVVPPKPVIEVTVNPNLSAKNVDIPKPETAKSAAAKPKPPVSVDGEVAA